MNRRLSKENLVWLTMRLAALILCAIWTLNLPAAAVEVPFAAPQTIDGAFDGARAVATGDIDGDGDLDVVAAATDGGEISLWRNVAGDGSAWTKIVIDASFPDARSIQIADIEDDGDLDVVAASGANGTVRFWGNAVGDGTSWSAFDIDTSFADARFALPMDVDGDGAFDVVAASDTVGLVWWDNVFRRGVFWTRQDIQLTSDQPRALFAADIDRDGDDDVLAALSGSGEIVWFENRTSAGASWTRRSIATGFTGAAALTAADVDGDGDVDAIGAAASGDAVAWWENVAGDGTVWTERVVDAGVLQASAVAAHDVDADGDIDIVGASAGSGTWSWWENVAGDGTAWTARAFVGALSGAAAAAVADLDGDGDVDLLGAASGADTVAWWANALIHRTARFAAEKTAASGLNTPRGVRAADLDGDGDEDLLGAVAGAGDVLWWENVNGDGSAWTERVVDADFADAYDVAAGDIDGDGDLDVAATGRSTGVLAWWENTNGDGSAWTRTVLKTYAGTSVVETVDLDVDGDLDILLVVPELFRVVTWINLGAGATWFERIAQGNYPLASSAAPADLNGDRRPDFVTTAERDGWIAYILNPVTGFQTTIIDMTFDGAFSAFGADLDGDGDDDLLAASRTTAGIAWYENTDGAATFGPRQAITTDFDGVAILRAADLDADGDIGVYASSSETDTLAWWENDGDGASWTRRTIDDAADGIWGVIAADPNGDGQVDLVGATAGAGAVGVWTGGGGQFALPTSAVAPALVADGVVASVLAIDATHRGRAGDSMAELATVELRVEDALGNALDDAQIDALLTRLAIHRDDGSGAFDAANDVEIGALTTFASVDDALSVPIADGQAAAQFAFGAPARVFVVATFENDASASGVGAIRFVHVTEASSTAEDASADLPIRLESSANVATDPVDFNVAPVAQDDAVALLEDAVGAAGNVLDGTAGGLDTDVNATPLTATLVDPPMHGALVGGLQPDGSFTYAPSADFNGVDQFTYRASDGLAPSNLATVTLTVQAVNDAPSFAVSGLASAAEDAGAQTVPGFATGIRAGPADEAGQVLLFTVTGNDQPGLFAVAPALASDGTLTYTSAPDVSGTATVTVRLTDDGGTANGGVDQSAEQSFDIVIDPVNDAPSFALGAGQHDALEDAGAQTVPGFATAIRAGPADEIGQVLTFTVTGNDNPGLFSAPPALAADGTLTYAGAPDASGTARITVRLADDGGTASGGVDQSDPQSFDIVIAAVNDAPSFIAAAADASGEDGGPQTVTGFATGISAGPTDEAGQGLTFAVMGNSNPGLFAAAPALASDGTLTYAGAPDASGVAQISVVLMDDGGVANGGVDASPAQIFDIVIDPINDPPSFDLAAQDATNEDAGPQTVPGFATALRAGPPDESGQTLSFSVTANTQPTLFATPPALAADGTLTYAAAPDANGTATITVVLMDSGGVAGGGVDTSPPQTFDVAIAAVNDAPSFSVPASTTVAATAAPQSIPGFAQMISAGPIDEAGQVLSFAITGNTQPGLFDVAPAIASDGALTFTLAAGASGTVAQLTAVLTDDGGTDLGGVDTSDPRVFALVVPDVTLPQVVALEALPGGAVETCAELRQPFDRLRVRFSETMADPLGDGDPADVTNAANYQLIASGPDRDIATLACDALEGDDVRIAVDGAVAIGDDARRGGAPTEVELTFDRLLPDGPYRLLVCDALEDDAGNALAATVDATFRVRADSLFVNGALDCDLDAWTITDDVQPAGVYSPEDVDDAEISGSILLTGQPGMRFAIGQCLTDASSIYDLSLAVRIDGAAEVRVQADVNCEGFTGAQCDGASLGSSVESFVLAPSGGAWQTLEHAASGGRSALCGVDLQLISGSSFEAYVDRLAASVILLNDGFESGDTAAWSATVP